VSDDFAGWKVALNSTLTKIPLDKGLASNREADIALIKQIIVLLRAECAAQGLTGI
jgi:hypothetical protein